MPGMLKKTGARIARAFLSLLAVLLLVVVTVQLVLLVGINALSTGRGAGYFAQKINESLADTPYRVGFSALYYDPLRGINLYDLTLADAQGQFLTLDRLSLSLSITSVFLRVLDVNVSGGTLVIERLPASNQTTTSTQGMQPFAIPDVFVHTLLLSGLSFDNVTLGADIAGTPYSFAPNMRARLSLREIPHLRLRLNPGLPDFAPGLAAPSSITAAITLNPQTLAYTLEKLEVASPDYTLDATATGTLAGSGNIALAGRLRHTNMPTLTSGLFGGLDASIALNGTFESPALGLEALITPASLKQHGLDDITLTFTAADILKNLGGQLGIKTSLKEQPVTLDADINYAAPNIRIQNLAGDAPALTLRGEADCTTTGPACMANVTLKADNLAHYAALLGTDMAGKLNITLALKPEGPEQSIQINGDTTWPVALAFKGDVLASGFENPLPTLRDIALTITQNGIPLKISGALSHNAVNLAFSVPNMRARNLPVALPAQLANAGIKADATITGTPAQPRTQINASISQNATYNIIATHEGKTAAAKLTGQGRGIRALAGDAQLPLEFALHPFKFSFSTASALAGNIAADLDLSALAPLFLPPAQKLAGALTLNATLGGSVQAPAAQGALRVRNGALKDSQSGLSLAAITADASFTQDRLTLTSLSATDGAQGRITGGGTFALGTGATDMSLRARNLSIPPGNIAQGMLDAEFTLKGTNADMRLAGRADIAQMHIVIPETFESSIPQLNIIEKKSTRGPGMLDALTLDIAIDARNQVFVRGWGLDAEFGGNIAITGMASDPQFDGTLASRRGRYEEFGKRFTLERANLRFQGSVPPSPYLDIHATTPAGEVTGAITLTGPVQAPKIAFTSTPALPEDEVLSRILFGREAARISPFQAVQLARTVQRFSGKGGGAGLDPLGMLRDATGLDDISVDTDESGAASVDVGKYLTDKVYLELSKGKGENAGAATIQIEVTPSINIESRMGQDAQGGGGVFWKRDY